MSDPVTNVEIEDVLSSIRRLVSNDSKADNPAPDPDPSPPEPDKLVLAPSFRVDDAAPATEDATDEARDDDAGTPELSGAPHAQPHAEDKDWSAVDAGTDAPATPDEGEQHWDAQDTGDDAAQDHAAQAADPDAEAENGDADASPQDDTLKSRVAELEQVVAARDDQWEPDGNSDDAYAGSAVSALPWEDYSPDETPDADPVEPEAAATPGQSVEKPAAKAAVTPPRDDIPDNFVAEEETDDTPPASEPSARDEDLLSANDDFLDEDALRDLVADIVRQELQGALGERITRNVRKLVRREIHRALASQDLE